MRAATAHAVVGRGLRFDSLAVVSPELRCTPCKAIGVFVASRCGVVRGAHGGAASAPCTLSVFSLSRDALAV